MCVYNLNYKIVAFKLLKMLGRILLVIYVSVNYHGALLLVNKLLLLFLFAQEVRQLVHDKK